MMILGAMAMLGVLTMTTAPLGAADHLESLGRPCRSRNVLAGRVVTDRASGRELFVLTNMNEDTGAELIFIDTQRNTARVIRAPKGAGSWALNEIPGDRLAVGTYYDGQFMLFDLKKMEFTASVGYPGETYIWNLALGSDGRLYGGTYPGGKLLALDLDTLHVEDCGAPAPPNLYLRNVSATPDGRILCNFGMDKPTSLLYDPAAKRFEPLPKNLEGVAIGVSWNGYFLVGDHAYQGKALTTVEPPPYPTPPADKGPWIADTYFTTDTVLFLHQGNAVYRVKKGDTQPTLIADIDLRGGRLLAGNREGDVLGVRGQDYFVLKPGDKTLTLKPIPGDSGPRPTLFLKMDPKGRLWGGPTFGQTLFWLDPRTKKAVNTGAICDGGGEVYDATFIDGVVYAASYAGGDIIRYDPAKPWDQWNHKNPQTIVSLGAKGYIRPTGGIVAGADGKLVSGWMAKYGVYGGALAVTDPKTGETQLIENPLGEQAVNGLAIDDRFAYIGTSLEANGLPAKKGESARFGVVDLASHQVVFQQTFAGAGGVGPIRFDRKTGRVFLAVDGKPHLFDTGTRQFVQEAASGTPKCTSYMPTVTGNGSVVYASGKDLIELDLKTGHWKRLAEAPAGVQNLAVGKDGALFFSCGADIYRLRR